jgi:2-polyprenyl-3-methyl-5-hydroxy-6-metoxy-1,4-benzoquinol methylase
MMENQSKYTKEEIKKIISGHKFEYHKVNLPYGLHTKGENRNETRELIFPNSLEGKSVLDIGCALGYMCFSAEDKGAKKVVGVELKESRFESAKILKDIKGSNVEFIMQDIIVQPINESFEIVLFLNVIHHLTEPFKALRALSKITGEQLIVEFPTLKDRKFKRSYSGKLPKNIDKFPLTGVSNTKNGQTFVFTPSALERVLMDHDHLFRSIDFVKSPIKGRMIAFCNK